MAGKSAAVLYKGTVSRVFLLLFFSVESVSPQPQSIPLGPFQICSKICGDIRKSRCTTGINDTGGNLPLVSTMQVANFATSFANVVDTSGKFAAGILTPLANNGTNYQTADNLK